MTGTIFNIQKFCINDGPGIRTTVFLKGCPLNCLWCHNPESKSTLPEIFYDPKKCIGCGACAAICPNGCHTFPSELHEFRRDNCVSCGACTQQCYATALEQTGHLSSVEEIIAEVMKDEAFYRNSGGGMTLSGGEPMAQFEFTYELLKAAKEKGLHTCMETCGFAPKAHYEKIAHLVDIFLFDYKLTDSVLHRKYTGVPNETIRENLRYLDSLGRATVLRCPIIPTVNDNESHLAGIAQTANELSNILNIDIEPYHPLGASKSNMLGKEYALEDLSFPDNGKVQEWMDYIQARTSVHVKKA